MLRLLSDNQLDNPRLLTEAAAEMYRMRRERDKLLPLAFVGEPAWDIFLALYSEYPSELPVSSLCYGAAAPPTTALRWVRALEGDGLVEHKAHPRDAELTLVCLTDKGRLMIERTLRAMLKAG